MGIFFPTATKWTFEEQKCLQFGAEMAESEKRGWNRRTRERRETKCHTTKTRWMEERTQLKEGKIVRMVENIFEKYQY